MKSYLPGILFLVFAAATIALCEVFPNAATNPEKGVYLENLPEDIPGHWSEEIPMSQVEKDKLPEDTGISRRIYYPLGIEDENMRQYAALTATIIMAGTDQRSLHRPQVCLRAAGWTCLKEKVLRVETRGGPLEVMHLPLRVSIPQKDGSTFVRRAHYLYWWVGKDVSTPHFRERLRITTMNNLLRNVNDRWAYPSVMVNVLGDTPEAEERALQRALEFVREYAPDFQKSLGATGDDSAE